MTMSRTVCTMYTRHLGSCCKHFEDLTCGLTITAALIRPGCVDRTSGPFRPADR